MLSKQHLLDAMIRECDISLHLYGKLRPDSFGYRPHEGQRTTLELLRYLSVCGIAGTRCMAERSWKMFSDLYGARAKEMPAEGFPDAMKLQKKELQEFFASLSEDTLRNQEAPLPGGSMLPLGAAILNGPVKWLTAYKMQLFLYAKASGASELVTSNAWRGVDPKPVS